MENCLITKLKASINNDDLAYLDKIVINAVEIGSSNLQNWTNQLSMVIEVTDTVVITVDGSGLMTNSESDLRTSTNTFTSKTIESSDGEIRVFFKNASYNITIQNKAAIKTLMFYGSNPTKRHLFYLNISHIAGCLSLEKLQSNYYGHGNTKGLIDSSNLKTLNLNYTSLNGNFSNIPTSIEELTIGGPYNIGGDISRFANSNLRVFRCDNVDGNLEVLKNKPLTVLQVKGTITGNISSLANCTDINYLVLGSSNISGNIESLGSMTSLGTLNLYETRVTGSVEEFVAAQKAAGRTETDTPIVVPRLTTYLTFGGVLYNKPNDSHLEWTNDSITVYTGASSYANCNNIYAKGATEEQIAAWRSAGKTVTVIS